CPLARLASFVSANLSCTARLVVVAAWVVGTRLPMHRQWAKIGKSICQTWRWTSQSNHSLTTLASKGRLRSAFFRLCRSPRLGNDEGLAKAHTSGKGGQLSQL